MTLCSASNNFPLRTVRDGPGQVLEIDIGSFDDVSSEFCAKPIK